MNVNGLYNNNSVLFQNRVNKRYEDNEVNLQVNDSNSTYATVQQDSFASIIWNMTDSMPRESQISFTAGVIANKLFNQGATDENKALLKDISNRFSADELNTLKSEILNDPKIQKSNTETVKEFLTGLDDILSEKANEALQSQLKEQNLHKFRTMDEIFFQTSLLFDATRKGLFAMSGEQEAINYNKA